MAKGPLLVLGVIILVSMGVGVLVGLQITDSSQPSIQNQTATESGPEMTPTPIPEQSNTSPTGETGTPFEQTEETQLRDSLLRKINEFRIEHNRDPLVNTGYPTPELRQMATNHSRRMANEDTAQIYLQGSSSPERYQENGLDEICPFPSDSGYSTIDPTVGKLELVANPIESSPYENVKGGYDGDVERATEVTVDRWRNSNQDRQKLLYKNAEQVGIGVAISEEGGVFITLSMCGA